MLRLLTDPRIALDPTRAARMPGTMVWTLFDALQLREHADWLNMPEDK